MQLKRLFHSKNQRGDTIVEVLVAVGIVSLILTSAYMLTNRNAQRMQSVREQTQAQKLVERQIELLRSTSDLSGFTGGSAICFNSVGVESSDAAECTLNLNGNTASAGDGAHYKMNIDYDSTKKVYAVSAIWDKLEGNKANITMYYYYDQ